MAILNKPVCTPAPSATSTTTQTVANTQPSANEINVICVDYITHGERETPWGYKPQAALVFEGIVNGRPHWYTRTYNDFSYSKSALTIELKNWLGRDIAGADQAWDREECIGEQATLKTSTAVSKAGNVYKKIESVNPGGTVHVPASGTYQRNGIEI